MRNRILILLCLTIGMLVFTGSRVSGASVTLAWDANTDPYIAGYRVYYGTTSGVYTDMLDFGDLTAGTVPNLFGGTTYYFAVTAYNTAGEEGPPSTEVSTTTINTDLSSLVLNNGALAPDFGRNVYDYAMTFTNDISSVTLTPTAAALTATVSVNGNALQGNGTSGVIPLVVGDNLITIVVTAADGITSNIYTIDITRLSGLDTWRLQNYGTSNDENEAADLAAPMGDGVVNLIKYATGMDPTVPGMMPGVISTNGTQLFFSYPRLKAAVADGTTFSVMWTDDLVTPNWSSEGVSENAVDQGATELVTAALPMGGAGRRFVQLFVSHP